MSGVGAGTDNLDSPVASPIQGLLRPAKLPHWRGQPASAHGSTADSEPRLCRVYHLGEFCFHEPLISYAWADDGENDAGESHYIGNIWSESQVNEDIKKYANNEDWPHFGWQPLIASFGNAYKHGHGPDGMRPQSDDEVIGAMWYRTFLSSGSCNGNKPANWKSAVDAVNWALVVDQGVNDLKVRVSSGGQVVSETKLSPGLNYAAAAGIRQGAQKVEVVRGDTVVKVAKGAKQVTDESEHCFYNFQVAGLE